MKKEILIFGFAGISFVALLIFLFFSSNVVAICTGYTYEGRCYNLGNELKINGTYYYVDMNGQPKMQKSDGDACYNNFECLNNLCSDGKCVNEYKELKGNAGLINEIEGKNITTCGNGVCDRSIGENEQNCPVDCNLPVPSQPVNATIVIQTTKEVYSIREKVELNG